jgi:hypothetical protein
MRPSRSRLSIRLCAVRASENGSTSTLVSARPAATALPLQATTVGLAEIPDGNQPGNARIADLPVAADDQACLSLGWQSTEAGDPVSASVGRANMTLLKRL